MEKNTHVIARMAKIEKFNKLLKIYILMILKGLSYIFLKVGENKVPLEFRFS